MRPIVSQRARPGWLRDYDGGREPPQDRPVAPAV